MSTPPRTNDDVAKARECLSILSDYRAAVAQGNATPELAAKARAAYSHLGGDPCRSSSSLRDYDHERHGPFLGVSDEGSAAAAIREAAFESPKVLARTDAGAPSPLFVGVALDAERLGGVGEVNVGPAEYADVWLEAVDRVLITTNVATRVNMRVYRREPRVTLLAGTAAAIKHAQEQIVAAFKPFVETPDLRPRPLTVFIEIPDFGKLTKMALIVRCRALFALVKFVQSGAAAGRDAAPEGQQLGLHVRARLGEAGRDQVLAAIDLAADAGIAVVCVEGVKRWDADRAISLAGLLDYFAPGHVGPIVRAAARRKVTVRTANLPDTDTIARSTWVALSTARSHGAHLGKYGCFPLTLGEMDHVIGQIQSWFPDWSAAPVFFVDQGLLRDDAVDVEHDLMRGLKLWLTMVARHGVKVVLIDTIDKANGRRLLKKDAKDRGGYLTNRQIVQVEDHARPLGVKVLWAGGLNLRDAYELGRLGVFGLYVTTAAATTIPVPGTYARDPSLAGLKEPSKEAVRRVKILIEAGFLSAKVEQPLAAQIADAAGALLSALEQKNPDTPVPLTESLAKLCRSAWPRHWSSLR